MYVVKPYKTMFLTRNSLILLMKKFFLILCVTIVNFLYGESVFWSSWDLNSSFTVREMQENIETLEQEKNLLEFKWKNFKIGSSSLWEILDKNLSPQERDNLYDIVELYSSQKSSGESILKSIINTNGNPTQQRRNLILLKKDFYTSIKSYISPDKLDAFLSYIETDLSLNEKSKDVDSQIQKIQNKKIERVDYYQAKIEDNNKVLRESIENKISTRIRLKLDIFVAQWSFSELSNSSKISIFDNLISKIDTESIRLGQIENSTSIIEEKILLFRVVVDILKEYTTSWEK